MKQIILPVIVFSMSWVLTVAHAEAPVQEYTVPEIKTEWTTDEVKELVNVYADKYGVSRATLQFVVSCESGYDYKAIGDGGKSFGAVQIHNPSHPTITREQAYDADFALNFLAENVSKGKGSMWTCYRKLK
jgi:hypothetical protein